uniref:DUF2963 domain-containing protein n=1 Tax=Phytoplasma australiense TaxID=59748 RepID=Q0QLC7_PHYAS|nr:hypothetical protein [Candidatus Phytoplasma australiense]ABD04142.1 hypothetical protein [Candidatus Phytoplasma australiense]
MSKNNSSKISLVFVFWALSISAAVIFILFLVFLSLKQEKESKPKENKTEDKQNEIAKKQQEQYNNLLNKLDKEIDKITSNDENKTTKKETFRDIYNSDNLVKTTSFHEDGKTPREIIERDPETDTTRKITYYNLDGTIKETYYF